MQILSYNSIISIRFLYSFFFLQLLLSRIFYIFKKKCYKVVLKIKINYLLLSLNRKCISCLFKNIFMLTLHHFKFSSFLNFTIRPSQELDWLPLLPGLVRDRTQDRCQQLPLSYPVQKRGVERGANTPVHTQPCNKFYKYWVISNNLGIPKNIVFLNNILCK